MADPRPFHPFVENAVGILAARHNVSLDEAAALLIDQAADEARPLIDVASDIVRPYE